MGRRKEHRVKNPRPGSHKIDLTGERFGKLVVIEYSHNNKSHNKVWKCECDCGNEAFATTTSLKQGKVTSCKCNQYKKGEDVYNYTGYKDITGAKWYSIESNAKVRNIEFHITKEMVWSILERQKSLCYFSGIEVSFKENTASVDRLDSKKSYVEDNIVIVHKDINRMKNNLDEEYFIQMCKRVAEKRGLI